VQETACKSLLRNRKMQRIRSAVPLSIHRDFGLNKLFVDYSLSTSFKSLGAGRSLKQFKDTSEILITTFVSAILYSTIYTCELRSLRACLCANVPAKMMVYHWEGCWPEAKCDPCSSESSTPHIYGGWVRMGILSCRRSACSILNTAIVGLL
jgi:hypothetical protein